ncbi:MAG: DJ-1/PfpI family protein [Fretibacterium sp.]|nr:DJ-1/PfpI family protein [Fretibacterium sp.]
MKKAAVFLIDGFEETEGLTTVDILRRGGVEVTTVSLTDRADVTGSHNIIVRADAMFEHAKDQPFDMLVIPGGTTEHTKHVGLLELVKKYNDAEKPVAAICAAPAVLARAGVLKGRKAVCYPGMESWLEGAVPGDGIVVTDENIITARGPAVTPFFALKLLEILCGRAAAEKVAEAFLIPMIREASF